MKRRATKEQVIEAASVLRDLDYAVMRAVTRIDTMTLKAADELVAMHRRLRRMRYEIEIDGGIDLPPCITHHQSSHHATRIEQ